MRICALLLLFTNLLSAQSPAPGTLRVSPLELLRYSWIPPGKFLMGCSKGDKNCLYTEKPAHWVEITQGFWLGETEVTVGAWRQIFSAPPSWSSFIDPHIWRKDFNPGWKSDAHPVIGVKWEEAQAYCQKVGGRLPTEAEWEYAARAGATSTINAKDLNSIAWNVTNSGNSPIGGGTLAPEDRGRINSALLFSNGNSPHITGTLAPNAWNLRDMLGNTWEWTSDWFSLDVYSKSAKLSVTPDPQGPAKGNRHVIRGGSWFTPIEEVRLSARRAGNPERQVDYGFRCLRPTLEP